MIGDVARMDRQQSVKLRHAGSSPVVPTDIFNRR